MSVAPGARLGPYEIQSVIGAGGMGVVYRARDPRLNRTVAIKVLSSTTESDPAFHERFTREARSISSLEHPHICAVYDVGQHEGVPYLVMQYLDGETLAARLARGPLAFDQALTLAVQVADALAAAHGPGIVHRDLKPANIILTKSGAKLLDFGLAKHRDGVVTPSGSAVTAATGLGASSPLTERGTILGTFHYMSPEQLRGEAADDRSDIFALGAVLYEAVSGRRPFEAGDTASLIAAVLDRDPPSFASSAIAVPPRFERILRTCLEKDPAERWQSSRDLLRELRWIAEERSQGGAAVSVPPPGRPSRRQWVAGGLAGFAVIALAVWGVMSRTGPPASAGPPMIVLMDSQHPARVYDPATRQAGGTNADDLTDLLRDLPVVLLKENTGPSWHREDQILAQNPSIILVHRSCFYDSTLLGDPELDRKFRDRLYPWPADKLDAFMGYLAHSNPRTRFVVYSRQGWASDADRMAWMTGVERRFPAIRGRLSSYNVPLDRATFRHPQTGEEIRKVVVDLLASSP